ncbi:MAG TPA: hypothetical protein VM286_09115 [Candidatus Thermoplasmatota archaeon]|nr:hypothetical protein [Candidatus Thermoplasmatota archaeon]
MNTKLNLGMAALVALLVVLPGASAIPQPPKEVPNARNLAQMAVKTVDSAKDPTHCPAYNDANDDYFGGLQDSCAYTCPGPGGSISGWVDADDSDATVTLNSTCASGQLHCNQTDSCDDTDTYRGSGAGTCDISTDEAFTDGVSWGCSSSIEDEPPVPTCDVPLTCELINFLRDLIGGTETGSRTHSVSMRIDANGTAGLSCVGSACYSFVPLCTKTVSEDAGVMVTRLTCGV